MRITDLKVDGFGMWNGLTISELSPGLTVFFGPNEAGKTTLLQFIRTVLYGLDDKRRKRYLPPVYGGRPGGSLGVRCPAGRFRAERHWGSGKGADREEFLVRGHDERSMGTGLMRTALGGIDESMFNNVFAVGLTELQQLGSLSDSQAAQQLYGLALGTDRVSLAEVSASLAEQRQRLWRPQFALTGTAPTVLSDASTPEGSGEIGEVERLKKERQRLLHALKESRQSTQRWSKLAVRRDELEAEIRQLEKREQPATDDLPWEQWIRRCRGKWKKCRELQQKLGADYGLEIPAVALERLHEVAQQLDQRQEKLAEVIRQQDLLRLETGVNLDRDDPTWDVSPVLELSDQRTRVRSLQESVRQGKKKQEELEFEFQAELEKNGFPDADRLPGALTWSGNILTALADPARYVDEQQALVEQFQREAEDRRKEADDYKQQYRDALTRLGVRQVEQAEEQIRQQCEALRERMTLQDQWEKLGRNIRDLQEEGRYWVERMVLPWRIVVLFGAIFSVGATMTMASLFHRLFHVAADQRGALALIGLCLVGAAIIMRRAMEFTAERRWEEIQEETRRLQRQRRDLSDKAGEIDRILPQAGGPWVKQLEKAQRELREVQALMPLYERQQRALAEADVLQRQVAEAQGQTKEARRGWQQALATVGLPDSLSYEKLRQIFADNGPLTRIRQRLETARAEQKQREVELDNLLQKVNRFADRLDLNLFLSEDDVEQRLVAVVDAARKYRETQQQTNELKRKMREFQREEQQLREAVDVLIRRRQQIVEQYRASDAQEVETRFQQQQQDREIRQQRDQLIEQLANTLSGHVSVEDLRLSLQQSNASLEADPVDKLLQKWDADHQAAEQSLAQLHEARGRITEQLKGLTRDQQSGKLKVKLEMVEARLRAALQRWTCLATMSHLLQGIRDAYESDRQPETLAEASTYLKQLTLGRYTRIWTPFGESSLSVDTHEGKHLPVSKLSRGTREQVYLSLRLALAAEYGRRGSPMPIVLDDVFVNFDTRRVQAAVNTLKDFAEQGHQVLVFTCHDHIRDMFRQLGSDVRVLPDARVIAGVIPPEQAPVVELPPLVSPEPVVAQIVAEPAVVLEPVAAPEPPPAERPRRKKRRPEPVELEREVEPVVVAAPEPEPVLEPVTWEPVTWEPPVEPIPALVEVSEDSFPDVDVPEYDPLDYEFAEELAQKPIEWVTYDERPPAALSAPPQRPSEVLVTWTREPLSDRAVGRGGVGEHAELRREIAARDSVRAGDGPPAAWNWPLDRVEPTEPPRRTLVVRDPALAPLPPARRNPLDRRSGDYDAA